MTLQLVRNELYDRHVKQTHVYISITSYYTQITYSIIISVCPNVCSRNQTSCAQNDVCNNIIIAISFVHSIQELL